MHLICGATVAAAAHGHAIAGPVETNGVGALSRHGRLVGLDKQGNPARAAEPVPQAPSRWPPFLGTRETGALFLTPHQRLKATDRVRLNWRHPLAIPAAASLVLIVPILVAGAVASKLWRMILYFRG